MRAAGCSQILVPRLSRWGRQGFREREPELEEKETVGERVMLGPGWRKELATLLGQRTLCILLPAPTCFSVIISLSLVHSIPGFIVALVSLGPPCSKGAEELSCLPAEAI